MTTTISNPPGLLGRSRTGPFSSGWSYIYIGWWRILFELKAKFGFVAAAAIVVLSAIELLGPAVHLIPEATWSPSKTGLWQLSYIHYAIAFLLFLTALLMIRHQGRLREQAKKYKDLVTLVMVLVGNSLVLADLQAGEAAEQILDALVHALHGPRKKSGSKTRINASILVRRGPPSSPFRIFAQDSQKAFDPLLEIPDDSVAGRVVRFDSDRGRLGALMYVPSTRHVHGIAFEKGRLTEGREVFTGLEIVPASYRVLDATTEIKVLKCLLCVQIPLKFHEMEYDTSNVCAVLSLSAGETDCLSMVSFSAAYLASAMLAETIERAI